MPSFLHALPHLIPLSARAHPCRPEHALLRRQLYDLLSQSKRGCLLCASKPRHSQAEHRDLILRGVSILQETTHLQVEQFRAHGLVTQPRSAQANR